MIDFHSHIVYGVDDGAKDIQESVEMLKEASQAGFTDIILTPHYMKNYYIQNKKEIEKRIKEIQKKLKEDNIKINLFQANEVYIIDEMPELINNGTISTINSSKYVLFELPMSIETLNLKSVIYSLLENGNIPIIAHPERYKYIQNDPNKLLELIEMGVLFQSNFGSILGQYGKISQKTVEKLLKHNMVHFLGTDTHRLNTIYNKIDEIIEKLNKIVSKEQLNNLLTNNAKKVLQNENINIELPIEIKNNFISKLFAKKF